MGGCGNCGNDKVKCPSCGKPLYLAEMTTKTMTYLCLECMWVYVTDGYGKKLMTLAFEKPEPDKSSLEARQMKALNLYQADTEILAFMVKVMSGYANFLQERLNSGHSTPVGHLMTCQMYLLQDFLNNIIGMLEETQEAMDTMIEIIEKEHDK